MKSLVYYSLLFLLMTTTIYSQVNFNYNYNYIDVNNIKMWICNNGQGSQTPDERSGFLWSGDDSPGLIYKDGLMWAGKKQNEIFSGGVIERSGLLPGRIINGIPDNPELDKYRIYKLNKYWKELPPDVNKLTQQKDFEEWPFELGAPFLDKNGDGTFTMGIDEPEIIGDETLWFIANDQNSQFAGLIGGSKPAGLEMQTTIYAYDQRNCLSNTIFKRYLLIKKSSDTLKQMYFSYWADPDIGYYSDDYSGCDTTLNLAYCYNSDNDDEGYYENYPPAVGFKILQGPIVPSSFIDSAKFMRTWKKGFKNLGMTSFMSYYPNFYDPYSFMLARQYYNLFQGKFYDSDSIIIAKYFFPGDPVKNRLVRRRGFASRR